MNNSKYMAWRTEVAHRNNGLKLEEKYELMFVALEEDLKLPELPFSKDLDFESTSGYMAGTTWHGFRNEDELNFYYNMAKREADLFRKYGHNSFADKLMEKANRVVTEYEAEVKK